MRGPGTVTEVVYLGTSTNYNVTTSAGADVVVFLQNATSADDIAVRGDSVWLSWDPRHSYAIGAPSEPDRPRIPARTHPAAPGAFPPGPPRRPAADGRGGRGLALSACGVKGQGGKEKVSQSDVQEYWSGKAKSGKLTWANWPGYMQDDRATVKAFEKETGIKVTYKEVIQEMGPWFGKIQAPLAAGQSIGFDLMVMTNGIQLEQCRQLGYLAPLDLSRLKNFQANAGSRTRTRPTTPATPSRSPTSRASPASRTTPST